VRIGFGAVDRNEIAETVRRLAATLG